jgi:hypothetical protein
MKNKTCQVAAGVALAFALVAAVCGAQSLRTVDTGGGLYLNQYGDRVTVREPDGAIGELSLPPGASLYELAGLEGGWVAAGEIDQGRLTDLVLLRSDGGVLLPVAAPPNAAAEPLRAGPMPLVEGGRLAGLAWLAGPEIRQTAVWAATWSGLDWGPPELVSPAGAGTQIAIDGVVLADGSWLLVWSGYDGGDDEILWSRRVGERWSEPAVLHPPNEWPDITPALVATGRGALVAWNAYDGSTYRVRLAAFEDGGWHEVELPSPAGAVEPGLTRHGEGALLLYRTAWPLSWRLHELDGRGALLRSAVAEQETTTRPGLSPDEAVAPVLEWPGESLWAPRRVGLEWRAEP